MYRFLVKPKWIAFHLLVAAAIATMLSLAGWQLRRLDERQDFNARVVANSDAEVIAISEVLTVAAPNDAAALLDLEWRRVEVRGTYLPAAQVEVVNRAQNGEVGRNVVDVIEMADGTGVVINRGFVPSTEEAPLPPTGEVTVIGRLRRSEQRRAGQTDDASGVVLQQVRRLDVAKLQPQVSLSLLPMFVDQLQSQPAEGAWPTPVPAPELGEGPHLSYAMQWLVFSICVAAGWVFAVRRSAAVLSGKVARKRLGSAVPIDDERSRELLEKRRASPPAP